LAQIEFTIEALGDLDRFDRSAMKFAFWQSGISASLAIPAEEFGL